MTGLLPPTRLAALAIALAAAAMPLRATATDPVPVPVSLALHQGRVAAAIDLAPVLPPDLLGRLGNGLRNVLAVYVGVVPLGSAEGTVEFARVMEVLYDVWEERWLVTLRDPASPSGRRRVVGSQDELRALLVHAADADLGPLAALPSSSFTVDVRIDVNPVSPELLARTREYLAGAAGRPGGASRSVLGAVAGFLLREPTDDADVLVYRSLPLSTGAVKPR